MFYYQGAHMRLHVVMLGMLLANFLNIECACSQSKQTLPVFFVYAESLCKHVQQGYDSDSDNGTESRPSSASSVESTKIESPMKWARQGSFAGRARRASCPNFPSHNSLCELCMSRRTSATGLDSSVTSPKHGSAKDHPTNPTSPEKDCPTNPKSPSPVAPSK